MMLTDADFPETAAPSPAAHFRQLGAIAKLRKSIVAMRADLARFQRGDTVYIKPMMVSATPERWHDEKSPFTVGDVIFCGTVIRHARVYLADASGRHAGSAPVDLLQPALKIKGAA